jgi:hypothetical protein
VSKRRTKAPVWVQLLVVWLVVSGLGLSVLLYLRASGKLSDAIFQPLAPALCGRSNRIETAYDWVARVPRHHPERQAGVSLGLAAMLRGAECVTPTGERKALPALLPALWVVAGAGVGIPILLVPRNVQRHRRRARSASAGGGDKRSLEASHEGRS